MLKSSIKPSFWCINISDRNVCLSDLAITIPAGRHWDLLDNKRFNFTIEQLKASMKSGSIYKKRDRIKIGKGPPQIVSLPPRKVSEYPIHVRPRSAVIVEDPQFDELIPSDQNYAEEMAREFDQFDEELK